MPASVAAAMRAVQQRMPVTFERDQDAAPSPSSVDDEQLCDRFTGAYSRGVARCVPLSYVAVENRVALSKVRYRVRQERHEERVDMQFQAALGLGVLLQLGEPRVFHQWGWLHLQPSCTQSS